MKSKDKIIIDKMIKYSENSIKYVKGLNLDSFIANELVLTYSVFALSQLGELVSKLSEEVKTEYDGIPWVAMKNIRNRIVHDYDGVQYVILWDTLINDIPPLIEQLRNIK